MPRTLANEIPPLLTSPSLKCKNPTFLRVPKVHASPHRTSTGRVLFSTTSTLPQMKLPTRFRPYPTPALFSYRTKTFSLFVIKKKRKSPTSIPTSPIRRPCLPLRSPSHLTLNERFEVVAIPEQETKATTTLKTRLPRSTRTSRTQCRALPKSSPVLLTTLLRFWRKPPRQRLKA